jgi:hypothetical protein
MIRRAKLADRSTQRGPSGVKTFSRIHTCNLRCAKSKQLMPCLELRGSAMRRRQFLALVGSMAIGCPADVVAQQSNRVRRIGVLMPYKAGDAAALSRTKIITQALQDLGWTDGQNTRIDYRWTGDGVGGH